MDAAAASPAVASAPEAASSSRGTHEEKRTSAEPKEDSSKRAPPEDDSEQLMCRVCRGDEGSLYYPCLCTGSIKYVHQECLVEWLKHSKREVCELCNHKYSFQPIYRSDMPKALPLSEILRGVGRQVGRFMRTWLVYTTVVVAWLGVVPLTAARVFQLVFSASFHNVLSLPFIFFTADNVAQDIARGCILLAVFVSTFISLLWLREQIVHAGPPEWLNLDGEDEEEVDGDEEEEDHEEEGEGGETTDTETEGVEEDEGPRAIEAPPPVIAGLAGEAEEPSASGVNAEPEVDPAATPGPSQTEEERLYQYLDDLIADADGQDGGEGRENEQQHEERQEHAEDGAEPAAAQPQPAQQNRAGGRRRRGAGRAGRAAQQGDGAQQGEDQWRDWDRLGDELTWQRLLGLDGSFVFIEHVFWVISLNTIFTIFFAYLPYKLGASLLAWSGASPISFFPSLAAVLTGYLAVSVLVYLAHTVAASMRMRLVYRWLGIGYLVLKVFILVLLEIGFFPVLCGCWLDICSLKLFSSSYSSRVAAFASAPSASVFLHWMIGMVYVFYSASFVILLREILRPGVLWFMRNLNDPEFNPIQEMIDQPVQRHIRRLVASTVLFFFAIMLVVYVPLELISALMPSILPYNMSLTAETPLSELSVELLILQVVLPALLEQTHARVLLKAAVRAWCKVVGKILRLDDYLLAPGDGDEHNEGGGGAQPAAAPENREENNQPRAGALVAVARNNNNNNDQDAAVAAAVAAAGGGLAAEHQALLLLRDAQQPLPYTRPPFFAARILALLGLLAMTTIATSLFFFVVPVWLGRLLVVSLSGHANVHELYTTATGAYALWLALKTGTIVAEWLPQGGRRVAAAIWGVLKLIGRLLVVAVPLALFIPLLFGVCFQMLVLSPIRVSANQTPLLFLWQDCAMGILHTKIFGAAVMMGPDWRLKEVFDQIYNDGLLTLRVGYIYRELIIPVMAALFGILSIPYLIARLIIAATGCTQSEAVLVIRFTYPALLFLVLTLSFIYWQMCKLRALADTIRNEKYLVGTQLVNYEREKAAAAAKAADDAAKQKIWSARLAIEAAPRPVPPAGGQEPPEMPAMLEANPL